MNIKLKNANGEYLYPQTKASLVDGLDDAIKSDVSDIKDDVDTLTGTGEGSADAIIGDSIKANLLGGTPDTSYDTLGEIATWIDDGTNGAKAIQNSITTLNGKDTVEGSLAKSVADGKTAIIGDSDDTKDDDTFYGVKAAIKAMQDDANGDHIAVATKTFSDTDVKGQLTVASTTDDKTSQVTYTLTGGILYEEAMVEVASWEGGGEATVVTED